MKYPQIIRDTVDFTSDSEVCNIGFVEGTLNDERPYRVEVWSSYGVTSATIFISIVDFENKTEDDIKRYLISNKIIEINKDNIYITEMEDLNDNEFLSINVPLENKFEELNKLLVKIDDYII